jgi:glycosyltransferase involved in cell wall biosynthesis
MEISRPKILYISPHYLHGCIFGGQLRALHVARGLQRAGTLSVALCVEGPQSESDLLKTREEFLVRHAFEVRKKPLKTLGERLQYELDPSFTNVNQKCIEGIDAQSFRGILDEYDLVWICQLKTANHFNLFHWPHSILDVDNLDSQIYESAAASGRKLVRKMLDRRMAWISRRREGLLGQRFDMLTVCSAPDRAKLAESADVHIIRNGFSDTGSSVSRGHVKPPRIGFIGRLVYGPNRTGIEWFIEQVWPLVKDRIPGVRLRLVGTGSEEMQFHENSDIDALGYVEETSREIASWSAMIVPIFVGAGTRIKIAEAFSRRCPVVSTTLGAYGYDVQHEREIMLADSADRFAESCVRLVQEAALAESICEAAWHRFKAEWTWEASENAVVSVVTEYLSKHSSRLSQDS